MTTAPLRPDTLPLSPVAQRVLRAATRRYAGTSLDLEQAAVEVALGELQGTHPYRALVGHLRREWGRGAQRRITHTTSLPEDWDAPDPLTMLRDHPAELWEAVGSLRGRARAVILLRFRDGLERAEVAERLGLTGAQVRQSEQAGVGQLREFFGVGAVHGTRTAYVAGCRCAACREAQAAYSRARRGKG